VVDVDHHVPALFRAAEDVIGESTKVISNVERGEHRSIPSQVVRDS